MILDVKLLHLFNNFAGKFQIFDTLIVFLAEYLQYVLVAAVLMNISRIVADVHYPSDIFGGAIVGIAVGYLVIYFAKKWRPEKINKPL